MSDTFAIPEALVGRVNSALADGLPMVLAYVNATNQARLSFRGSTHVHGDDQLAIWVRDPEGGLLKALGANSQLTMMYRDPATRTTVFFYGNGHVEDAPELRERVYNESPEQEQKADPDKKGKPLVIDLHQIQGRTPDGPVNLTKS